jgi:hypothetical protein
MEKLQHDFDEKIHDGFEMLNNTLEAKIKSRVSDMTCEKHREQIAERKQLLNDRIIVLETQRKITNAALILLIPSLLIGLVYGILMYQKVEDLRDKINNNPQIVKTIDI